MTEVSSVLCESEEHRTKAAGFGTTRQGQALTLSYREQLTNVIRADRTVGGDKAVWRALRGIDDDTLAIRLLVAGISVSECRNLGIDDDGEKSFRDQALWIGRTFDQRGELALRVGTWASTCSWLYQCLGWTQAMSCA